MGFVCDGHRIVASAESIDFGDRSDVPVHRKDSVGDNEGESKLVAMELEQRLESAHIAVRIDEDLAARELAAIDQASVVEGIGQDEVLSADNGPERTRVARVSAREHIGGFRLFPVAQGLNEFHVRRAGTGHGGACPTADARFAGGLLEASSEFGVPSQTEIVVGAKMDETFAPPFEGGGGNGVGGDDFSD